MPRIALITPMLPLPRDATRGRYIHETARSLARLAELKVFHVSARYPRIPGLQPRSYVDVEVPAQFELDGIEVEALRYLALPVLSRVANPLSIRRVLLPRLRAFKPDLVLAYWIYPDGAGALLSARTLGVPAVLGALGSDIHVRAGLMQRLTRWTLQRAEAVLTVSEAMRSTSLRDFGMPPERVHTVVNGINTAVFRPQSQAAARAALGIEAQLKLITYVGRFVVAKGLRELLQAFAALYREDASRRLVLVGDGVMRAELLHLIEAQGLRDGVLLPGALEPEAVSRWVAASDVLTLPSWSEGYPNVVVEGIACGRPVVATDVGGTREIIDVDSGLLIPPRDPAALEAALRDALQRDWDHAGMARRMRRSWDDVAADTLRVCSQVLAQTR